MKFKVIKSTESINGGFVNTLAVETTIKTPFGESMLKTRFYTKTVEPMVPETEVEAPLSMFRVEEIPSENAETGEIQIRKWLFPRGE